MKRWILRLAGICVIAIAVVTVAAWLTLRASLPDLDGDIATQGLEGSVTIERDAAGIPTITASNRIDLAFATGFVHGQDRFFQMDTIRRRAAGELSEIIGRATIETDKRFRFHRFRIRARAVLNNLPDWDRKIVDRYAEGVNAGLASLGAKPFEYYLLGVDPEPWQSEDSLLAVYTMFAQLNDSRAIKDVRRGLARRVLPYEVYAWLYPQGTPWDAPLIGAERQVAAVPPADVYSVRDFSGDATPANEQGKRPLPGSNNWAVGGAITRSGRAIVSNDMHLGHSAPNIYYQARLVDKSNRPRDVTGVTLPGAPFVVAGSNGHVAWGYTNSYGDWSDAILLRPGADSDSYQTPDGDMEIVTHNELIHVKDERSVALEIRETTWGPILDSVDYPDGDIAVAWIAHDAAAVNLRLMDLETVTSVDEALDVANTMGLPPQNFVTGDAEGNIGWTIAGKIPLRADYDAMLPADWSETAGWTGWVDPEDYPRVVNPPSQRIWTANARVVDGQALEIIGNGGYDLGARAQQIRDALFAKDEFEPTDMLAIQYDDRAIFLARWRELLLSVIDERTAAGDIELSTYRRLVENWMPKAAPESVGYRLVRAFRLEVQARVFHGLMAPVRKAYGDDVKLRRSSQFEAPLWALVTKQPEHLLPADYDSWPALLLAVVRQNIDYFSTRFEGPLEQRTWGELNTAQIRHPLSPAVPFLSAYLDMPREPLNGDNNLPKAQGPNFGASERFSVAPGDEENGLMHMPTGQSGHPLSDFYRHGHDDWVKGRPSPFLPGETVYSITLSPGAG